MGKKKIYDEQYYQDLVTLDIEELHKKYPLEDKNKLRASQRYHRRKKLERLPDHLEAKDGAKKWWEVVTSNPEDPENPIVTRVYAGTAVNEGLEEVFEPAQPAKIRPTKRKREQRLGRSILVFGDSQIGYMRFEDELVPTHSEEALSVIQQLNADLMPDEIVNLSDMVDLAELGRFDPKTDAYHRTLSHSFQRAHDFYAQLRADNPDAKITEVDSNHNARTQKAMMKRYPEWYQFILPGEDYPMMSYYRLANLAPLDINWIPGYGSAEYVYGEENPVPIVFKHGVHSSSSPGATVRKEAQQNPTVSVVRGHGHSYERITQTDRNGNYHDYIQLGTTCQTTGNVPSYHQGVDDFGRPIHNQENWQNNAMLIKDYGNGIYQYDEISILRGIAIYQERVYDGNDK